MLAGRYREGDYESLVELYKQVGAESHTMGVPPVGQAHIEPWLDKLLADGWNLVALDSDRVIGHVAVTPIDAVDPEFVIFVADQYQERGVGGELLRQLVAHAADQGHDALTLKVSTDNQRASAVYQNIGFEVVEREIMDFEMELSLQRPIADRLRRPPAERE